MSPTLNQRCCIVTGATSGIGQAVCEALLEQGANLLMASRQEDKLQSLQTAYRSQYPQQSILYHGTDVTAFDQVEAMVKVATDAWQQIDCLINCAGVMYYTYMTNRHLDEWLKTLDVNCKGPLHTIHAALPSIEASQGHIVNITSDAARGPFPGLAAYCGSKSFLESLSRTMRIELADKGVSVTTVQPGNVNTNLFSHTTDEQANQDQAPTPDQHILSPQDIARAIVYALKQPRHVAVNELLVQPSDQPI